MQNKEFLCTECGFSNPIGFSFCARCGKKFAYTCPDCNTEVSPETKYCTLCGAELAWSIPSREMVEPNHSNFPAAGVTSHQAAVRPVQIKINESPGKAVSQVKARKFNAVPWIIVVVLIIITIILLLNFDSLFK
jgi:hypothetical protein